MVDLSAGRASMPPRVAAFVTERDGLLAAMPAYLPSSGALTTKLVSLFPRNRDRPTHQAVICCFDPDTGTPVALIDGTHVTAARTAAGSALATRVLARHDAAVVSVIGTGVQAAAHAHALARSPNVKVIRVGGRQQENVEALVAQLQPQLRVTVEAAASIEDAIRSADIVCATTHADQPVVRREWLATGTHVNSVGFNATGAGEVDEATLRDALVVVESRGAALAPPPTGAVEFVRATERGINVHGEIGEIVAGTVQGRTNDTQITLYKSMGVAVQDAAAAAMILRAARDRGVGTDVEM
jgi:ornithine cyclodeaminase/alanine dehydrogenase-like protein (mu-crystallin family)